MSDENVKKFLDENGYNKDRYKVDRDETIENLKTGCVEVSFTKVNGDKRVMTCTLQESIVPVPKKDDSITQKKVREVNPEVQVVWDTTAGGWRSFRWENVTEAKKL